jgi:predicted secreted Zn-dependent protease
VEARNLSDFVAVMQKRKAEGDGDWPGRTTATLQVRYRLLPVEDGCRVEQLGVALDVVIRLPHWEPADAARAAIREQWERMKIGIETHERGHRDIAVDAAAKLAERLAAFVPTPGLDCAAVDRRILRERLKAQMAHQGRDQAYDRRTRHGLTQVPEGPGQTERRRELPTSPASVAPRNRL